jgi:hypothetical protein
METLPELGYHARVCAAAAFSTVINAELYDLVLETEFCGISMQLLSIQSSHLRGQPEAFIWPVRQSWHNIVLISGERPWYLRHHRVKKMALFQILGPQPAICSG